MKELIYKIKKIRNARQHVYMSSLKALYLWIKNRKIQYRIFNLEETKVNLKKSDCVFILGSGPSLNTLTIEELSTIKEMDSIGISYSFLKTDLQPTFHIFSYETDGSGNYLRNVFSKFRNLYQNTSIFILDKALYRFVHPRLMPDFFPDNPKCSIINFPSESIIINQDEQLSDEIFDKETYVYRGSMSTALHIAIKLEYKKIVLIGVDLDTFHHFFDDHPLMQEHIEKYFAEGYRKGLKFDTMYTRTSKSLTFDEYLAKLESYLRRKKGIQLYTSRSSDFMAGKLPIFFHSTN